MVPIEKRYPACAFGTRKRFIALIFTNASDLVCRTCMLINIHVNLDCNHDNTSLSLNYINSKHQLRNKIIIIINKIRIIVLTVPLIYSVHATLCLTYATVSRTTGPVAVQDLFLRIACQILNTNTRYAMICTEKLHLPTGICAVYERRTFSWQEKVVSK